mgnify:CR=1 FL=1
MRIKLKDAFELQIGKTPSRNKSEYWNGVYKWVSVSDIGNSEKYVYSTRELITDKGIIDSGIKVIPKGTVIMSFKLSIGKTAITTEDMYTNEAIVAFIDKKKISIDIDYLYYLCSGSNWMQGVNKAVMGLTLNKATLSEKEINIPNIEIQKKCAGNLDKIDRIIDLKKQQLDQLDLLVRSLFIEMFGDLVKGKYEIKKLKDISKKISDGIHSKPEYTKTGRPFLSVVNINKGKVNFEDCKYVSEESFQKMIKSTHPEKGDILYTKVGATYGIAAYIDTNVEFCLYVSVCLIKPKHYLINAKFLSIQMNMPFIKYQADNRIKGIGVPDLHLNQIREFDIIVPPLDIQNRFADYVSSIDKSKYSSFSHLSA